MDVKSIYIPSIHGASQVANQTDERIVFKNHHMHPALKTWTITYRSNSDPVHCWGHTHLDHFTSTAQHKHVHHSHWEWHNINMKHQRNAPPVLFLWRQTGEGHDSEDQLILSYMSTASQEQPLWRRTKFPILFSLNTNLNPGEITLSVEFTKAMPYTHARAHTHTRTHTPTHTHIYESSFISWLSVRAIFRGGAGLSPSPCSCSLFFAAFFLSHCWWR